MKCKDGASQAASPPNRPVLWPDHNRNALKSESDRAFTSQHSTLVDFAAEGEELLEATSNRDAQTKGNRERSERIVSENAAHVVGERGADELIFVPWKAESTGHPVWSW